MAAVKPRRLFVDANAIIGAFGIYGGRGHLWAAVCESFSVETVAACMEETQRGDPGKEGYTHVPPQELARARVHALRAGMGIAFELQSGLSDLGTGEAHLLAWLYLEESNPPHSPGGPRELPADLRIATVDRIALRGLHRLGWLQDHVVSLEWLAKQAGVDFPAPEQIPEKHRHQIETWLQRRKRLLLG